MQVTIADRKLKYLPRLPKSRNIRICDGKEYPYTESCPDKTGPVLLERIKLVQVEKEYFDDNLIRRHAMKY